MQYLADSLPPPSPSPHGGYRERGFSRNKSGNKITSTGSKTSRIQDLLGRANPEEDRQHIIRQSCPENYIQMKKIRPGAGIKIYLSRSAAVNFAGGGS